MQKILWIAFAFVAIQCNSGPKYYMCNMLGEDVNVTDLVVEQHYKPVYAGQGNDTVICALIKPLAPAVPAEFEPYLKNGLLKWAKEDVPSWKLHMLSRLRLYENSKYQYSYFIDYYLVDVFKTTIYEEADTLSAYFRIENGKLMLPYSTNGWVSW